MVISASRRTDIPAFYTPWFFHRLEEGFAYVRNPINFRQISKVSLTRDSVDCFVFWSKDPEPMISRLPVLMEQGFPFYFQFTLTPYDRDMELCLREKSAITKTFQNLSKLIGSDNIIWRYDPVILNDKYNLTFHQRAFEEYASRLCGYTKVCNISFVDIYQKLKKQKDQKLLRDINTEEMSLLAEYFASVGEKYGIAVRSCCEEVIADIPGIGKASCIDAELISRLLNKPIKKSKAASQRPGCSCMDSIDIGAYNTCGNGCLYCYANTGIETARQKLKEHQWEGELLSGTLLPEDKLTERIMKKITLS